MKNLLITGIIAAIVLISACSKDDTDTERFRLLTSHEWTSDSLLIDGVDASGPGQQLEKFKGDAIFNTDGSGTFGDYEGTWRFAYDETKLVIKSDSLPVPSLSVDIEVLTAENLKLTTAFPNQANPSDPLDIRMTFVPK